MAMKHKPYELYTSSGDETVITSMRFPKNKKLEMDGYFHSIGMNFSEGIVKFASFTYALVQNKTASVSEDGKISITIKAD